MPSEVPPAAQVPVQQPRVLPPAQKEPVKRGESTAAATTNQHGESTTAAATNQHGEDLREPQWQAERIEPASQTKTAKRTTTVPRRDPPAPGLQHLDQL
jgi:hypothetical protein